MPFGREKVESGVALIFDGLDIPHTDAIFQEAVHRVQVMFMKDYAVSNYHRLGAVTKNEEFFARYRFGSMVQPYDVPQMTVSKTWNILTQSASTLITEEGEPVEIMPANGIELLDYVRIKREDRVALPLISARGLLHGIKTGRLRNTEVLGPAGYDSIALFGHLYASANTTVREAHKVKQAIRRDMLLDPRLGKLPYLIGL